MESRTKHTYRTALYEFVRDILVICPHCEHKAIVHTGAFHTMQHDSNMIKISCTHCGYNKHLDHVTHRIDKKQKKGHILIFGAPVDPFFHLPLWLQHDYAGDILWAYNLDHLDFLAQHIGAKLRERNGFKHQVKSIGARLPRWMTEAHHRETLLKVIEKLKTK